MRCLQEYSQAYVQNRPTLGNPISCVIVVHVKIYEEPTSLKDHEHSQSNSGLIQDDGTKK
jgi:hypothetical protein